MTIKRSTLLLCLVASLDLYAQEFKVSFSPSVWNQPFSGGVVVYLSKENKQPKDQNAGLDIFPCFSIFVKNVRPGETVILNDKAKSYPDPISEIERSDYYAQVVWDRNSGGRAISASPGNLYSKTIRIHIDKDFKKIFEMLADQVIPEPQFVQTKYVKELKAPSTLLSRFHNKPMTVDAAVVLPKEYFDDSLRKFPVLFVVFGYGGDYHAFSNSQYPSQLMDSIPVINVFLDGNCSLGHSVYANSDNNGPWGDALTTEFIPMLEKEFRCNGARLITGHSSGGWTVVWLQTHYSKIFDACWSSSPDPVDFRNFQKINLYKDRNAYYDSDSSLRQVGTVAGRFPWISTKTICSMENVIYRGEQMHSFNAVFSRMGKDGWPEKICNEQTGVIDSLVFDHWKNYDISFFLRNHWDSLKASLDGKIRISVGRQDNFLLNYSVAQLEEEMKKLHADFTVAYYPGDHFTVFTPEYRSDGTKFLAQKYRAWLNKNSK